MIPNCRFYCPTEIVFGRGKLQELNNKLESLGVKRVFFLFDSALSSIASLIEASTNVTLVSHELQNGEPSLDLLSVTAEVACASGCDGVVALGGGSVIDIGKVIAVTAAGVYHNYRAYLGEGGSSVRSVLPLVAIPTTAGTGAEVTRGVAVVDDKTGAKIGFAKGGCHPRLAILDPSLTDLLPPTQTSVSGLDAFCQALEAYISPRAFPTTDCFSLQALRWVNEHFALAIAGGNPRSRDAMMIAATFSALSFSTGSGLTFSHHFSDLAGPQLGIPHGYAASLLIPGVVEQAYQARPERFDPLAQALGVSSHELVFSKISQVLAQSAAPSISSIITLSEALELAEASLDLVDDRAPFSREEALEAVMLSFQRTAA
ncbi:iron-containing alcohol dehydrogenase [Labrenzia sp. DG1229]|uniref:iron-containing alcohol dehydrogenase family protein n=1 Tax=Labrenzia sp. DG1229 TaxID=681847 RepID=UPI00048B2DBB|nr:iron-containing alcohol dehydrogenase [Labrenzia sp. DG1229]